MAAMSRRITYTWRSPIQAAAVQHNVLRSMLVCFGGFTVEHHVL